jgi:long-chain acyl-CoA synthetase
MLLHHPLQKQVDHQPDKVAIIHNDRKYSYCEVLEKVTQFATWIIKNCKNDEKIGIILENCPQTVFALYGITMAGRICVPLDADLHERNLKYIVDDCEIKTIITYEKYLNRLGEEIKSGFVNIIKTDDPTNALHFDTLQDGSVDAPLNCDFDPQRTAFILYTTGTTGPQKGVELSHFNLLEATRNINEFMQLTPDLIESLPMRLSHSFGFARLRSIISAGGTAILENGFLRPERVIFNLKKYQANAISSVPGGFAILLDYYGKYFTQIGSNIKFIEIGSSFMKMDHKNELMRACPNAKICMHYGLTEASRSTFIDFRVDWEMLHTVGKPAPNVEVKIVKEDVKGILSEDYGEIYVKGKMVAKGYFQKPEQTLETFHDGWLKTGDIGKVDQQGYVHLLGRKKEMINVGGLKVAPGEVEEVLLRYPGIEEAAVVGEKTNDINNERVMAYVVTKTEISQDKLKEYCVKNLESYKIPQIVRTIDKLPKTGSGKIQKQLLKDTEV